MKVYQVKVAVRGNPSAVQTFLVEGEEYKIALIKAIERFSKDNNFAIDQCAVAEMSLIEEIAPPVVVADKIKVLRVDGVQEPIIEENK